MHKGKEKVNEVIEKTSDISVQMTKSHLTTQTGMQSSTDDRFESSLCDCLAADRAKEGGRLLGTVLPKRIVDRSANSQYLFIYLYLYLYLSVYISPSSWRLWDSEDVDLLTHPEERLGYRLDGHPIHV